MSAEQQDGVGEQHVKMSTTVGYFDKYLEALASFREEGSIVFKDGNVFSKVVDPANVAMCVSKIEGQALNSLSINGTDSMEVGLRFEEIREYLSGTSNTSELEITWPVTHKGSRDMRLDVIDEDLQFEVPALDTDAVPSMPQKDPLSHSTRVVISGSDLKSSIKHASKFGTDDGGSVIFETHDGVFELRVGDKVDGRFKKQFHQSGPSDGNGLGEHQTQISLGYLNDIRKVFGRGAEITMHIKDEHPVRFDIDLDDNGDAKVIYIIAPRLDRDG